MNQQPFYRRVWGGAAALLDRSRPGRWVDLLLLLGLFGAILGLVDLAREATGALQVTEDLDLSLTALPRYTFYSLMRGLVAYGLSLVFTLVYGYWAAKDKVAERVLIPVLDILQSIPVLAIMPVLVIALVGLFPGSNVGLELAAVVMIFTGQAWNMTFSFYHSVKSVPQDLIEAGTIYRFNWWQRFRWVELPYSMMGLVWNSMMSMAGGWFFLMTVEALNLEGTNYRLPGIGSYMQVAVDKGDAPAMLAAIVAMVLMIVALDQFLWRPVVVWAQKFRVEEGGQGQAETSWFLTWLRRSRLVDALVGLFHGWSVRSAQAAPLKAEAPPSAPPSVLTGLLTVLIYLAILVAFFYGAWQFVLLLLEESVSGWGQIGWYALLTLARVLLAVALGTLWALPAGLAIGLSPRLSRVLQPVVQVVASFPAPMLFPLVIWMLNGLGVTLGWGSVVLMLLGTQWYILFNIIAGAMSIPADLKEAARSYRIGGWQRFWHLYFPAVFPYLVTGWVTAAGGAWNASIVAEFVTYRGEELVAPGLGAHIRWAADGKHFPELAASVLVMSSMVVLFNRIVWRRCYELAESKFSLNK